MLRHDGSALTPHSRGAALPSPAVLSKPAALASPAVLSKPAALPRPATLSRPAGPSTRSLRRNSSAYRSVYLAAFKVAGADGTRPRNPTIGARPHDRHATPRPAGSIQQDNGTIRVVHMISRSSSQYGLLGLVAGAFVVAIGLTGYNLQVPAPDDAASTHPIAVQDGAEIYMTRCMSCHQANGAGVPGVFPPLSGSEWVTEDKGRLIRIILNGVTGEMEVDGDTYNGAMPPWGSFLDDEDMAALLTYIRTSWDNEASEITPEEVQKVRAAVQDRKDPWTVDELQDPANQGIPGEESGEKSDDGETTGADEEKG